LTTESYRMWSIEDKYPAMLRDTRNGAGILMEAWKITAEALVKVLQQEPPGLCVGKIQLQDRSIILGILGESYICGGQKEITHWGGWRNYCAGSKPTLEVLPV
ncbi:MAG: hypothetical protein WBV22_00130, partial [Anaerolineaceae bacterium]